MSEIKDKDELLDLVSRIRRRFRTEVDDSDESQLSFIDELNSLIRKIFKDDPADVYTTLTPGELEKWKSKRFKRWVSKKISSIDTKSISYLILLCTITGFLVSEAVSFYAAEGSSEAKTWIKAILTEACFIFLSGYSSEGKVQTSLINVLRACMFSLMVFVITSDLAFKSISTSSESSSIVQQIHTIEEQIKDKENTIKFYKDKSWATSVNKHEKEKSELVNKLILLQEEQSKGKNIDVADIVRYQAYGRAAFRIMLMLISVLVTRRLFKF